MQTGAALTNLASDATMPILHLAWVRPREVFNFLKDDGRYRG